MTAQMVQDSVSFTIYVSLILLIFSQFYVFSLTLFIFSLYIQSHLIYTQSRLIYTQSRLIHIESHLIYIQQSTKFGGTLPFK